MKDDPSQVSQAVRKLRLALGESQQAFAYRMKAAVRTIARWETTRPPKGKALADLNRLALENCQWELGEFLSDALKKELGFSANLIERGMLSAAVESAIDDMTVFKLPKLLRRLGHLELALMDDQIKPEDRLNHALNEVKKLRQDLYMLMRLPTNDKHTRPEEGSGQK